MYSIFTLVFLLFLILCKADSSIKSDKCISMKPDFYGIRTRRYLAFPDGTHASITLSVAKTFMTHAPSGWYVTSDLDVLFNLPDSKFISAHSRRKLHHRQKREIWDKISKAFNLHNTNGQECVLRSICEAKLYLAPKGQSLVHDLVRAIFTAPVHEAEFIEEFDEKYKELMDPNLCERHFDCHFSILHFILAFNKQHS